MQSGDKELILNYLETKNISNPKLFNFNSILWMLKDKDFFQRCISILKKRMTFNHKIWTFSLYHGDFELITELIQHTPSMINGIQYFKLKNTTIDTFSFEEFKPIINSRFHQLGGSGPTILNNNLATKYTELLNYLFKKKGSISDGDWLVLAYYFILQDRIEEAIEISQKINPESNPLKIQYDYMMAFFDMYVGMPEFKKAREICGRNVAYPIEEWRNLFIEIVNQISEFDGDVNSVADIK